MLLLNFVLDFFVGIFLCNAIPHLTAGLMGEAFPTPFASPPGKGNSSPITNVLWGTGNIAVGAFLYSLAPFGVQVNIPTILFFVGFLLTGLWLAYHFRNVRGNN